MIKRQQQVIDALATLGRSPEVIRLQLLEQGIRGYPEEPARCPIAQYIRKRLNIHDAYRVTVATARITVDDVTVPTPPAVRWFINGFDRYHYPELIIGARPWGATRRKNERAGDV
jgi:hypothetical protein